MAGGNKRLGIDESAADSCGGLHNKDCLQSIFMRVHHDLHQITTADENVPDSPFQGGEGDVSVPV